MPFFFSGAFEILNPDLKSEIRISNRIQKIIRTSDHAQVKVFDFGLNKSFESNDNTFIGSKRKYSFSKRFTTFLTIEKIHF
jgi:hypothetical protein